MPPAVSYAGECVGMEAAIIHRDHKNDKCDVSEKEIGATKIRPLPVSSMLAHPPSGAFTYLSLASSNGENKKLTSGLQLAPSTLVQTRTQQPLLSGPFSYHHLTSALAVPTTSVGHFAGDLQDRKFWMGARHSKVSTTYHLSFLSLPRCGVA